jgi:excisionase family DNA binding protein
MMPRSVARLSSDDIASDAAAHLAGELPAAKTLTLGKETIALSDEARVALSTLFQLLASGQRVEVVPVADTLTTQQAAHLLDVSRPTLVKLLESGLIPYERPGVHRRISRAAIDAFIASRPERRRAGLEALAETLDPDVPDEHVTTR